MKMLIYGTAWKRQRTADLVETAIQCGFRAIDSACQPKHYNEKGVGDGLVRAYEKRIVSRDQIYIQTKFTSLDGQDDRNIPYDPTASLEDQLKQSFAVSQANLRTSYLDALILHSPLPSMAQTIRVWRAMEQLVGSGHVRALGISNCYDPAMLQNLFDLCYIKPSILQNRFYDETGYDTAIRSWCIRNNVRYQSFWTLTANPHILSSQLVLQLAAKYGKTPEQVLFRYLTFRNVDPLIGSTSTEHMQQDIDIFNFEFDSSGELNQLDELFSSKRAL